MDNGVSAMSSEEMRVDLESFVNQGLAQGWLGWPVKGRGTDEDPQPIGGPAMQRCRMGEALRLRGGSLHFVPGSVGPGMSLS
jgi:hypothetical protein